MFTRLIFLLLSALFWFLLTAIFVTTVAVVAIISFFIGGILVSIEIIDKACEHAQKQSRQQKE